MKQRLLISNNLYWDFEKNPIFIGIPLRYVVNDNGELIGVEFEDEHGEIWNLPANFSIIKACQTVVENDDDDDDEPLTIMDLHKKLKIEFLGGALIKGSRPFKRFRIYLLEEDFDNENDSE